MTPAELSRMRADLEADLDVVADILPRSATLDAVASVDAAVSSLGMRAIADAWVEIDRETALDRLACVLARDLAYGHERLSPSIATDYASRFLGAVGPARYFTNGSEGAAWTSVTEATFDAGVVAVGVAHVGVLWVRDED